MPDLTAKDILTQMRARVEENGGLFNDDECPRYMLRNVAGEPMERPAFRAPEQPEAALALAALDEAADDHEGDEDPGGKAEQEANRLEIEVPVDDCKAESLAYIDRALALV